MHIRPLTGADNWQLAQQRNRGLLDDVLRSVRAIPGVDAAALVSGGVPLRGDLRTVDFGIPGRVMPPNEDLDFNEISPSYFQVLGVPLLRGRFFDDQDRQGSEPVVIINDAAARKYFPGEDPIGQHRRVRGRTGGSWESSATSGTTDPRRTGGIRGSSRCTRAGPSAQPSSCGSRAMHGDVVPAVKSAIWTHFSDLALPDVEMLSGT